MKISFLGELIPDEYSKTIILISNKCLSEIF